jgi:hypothetical protein
MRVDDGTADRESQPYSTGFGREKGFEDAFEVFRINARPRITDRDQDLTRSPSLGADQQLSARAINQAHRFDCVQDQVQDNLLQLHPVPLDERQAFQLRLHRDAILQRFAAGQDNHLADRVVKVKAIIRWCWRFRDKFTDPPDDIAGSIDVAYDTVERFPHLLQIWRTSG